MGILLIFPIYSLFPVEVPDQMSEAVVENMGIDGLSDVKVQAHDFFCVCDSHYFIFQTKSTEFPLGS